MDEKKSHLLPEDEGGDKAHTSIRPKGAAQEERNPAPETSSKISSSLDKADDKSEGGKKKDFSPGKKDEDKEPDPNTSFTSTITHEEPPQSEYLDEYTVVPGDSLSKIALHYYGKGARWPVIYEANKEIIGANPSLIHPGQVFKIPRIPEE